MKIIYLVISMLISFNSYSNIKRFSKVKSDINVRFTKLKDLTKCNLKISSGYRTVKQNRRVNGARYSYHLKDLARDVVKDTQCKLTYRQIGLVALSLFQGVIVYKTHIHVDLRSTRYHRL